ncbi:MAG: hypothetical protein U0326_34965 [Polyangiales bacterium]
MVPVVTLPRFEVHVLRALRTEGVRHRVGEKERRAMPRERVGDLDRAEADVATEPSRDARRDARELLDPGGTASATPGDHHPEAGIGAEHRDLDHGARHRRDAHVGVPRRRGTVVVLHRKNDRRVLSAEYAERAGEQSVSFVAEQCLARRLRRKRGDLCPWQRFEFARVLFDAVWQVTPPARGRADLERDLHGASQVERVSLPAPPIERRGDLAFDRGRVLVGRAAQHTASDQAEVESVTFDVRANELPRLVDVQRVIRHGGPSREGSDRTRRARIEATPLSCARRCIVARQ